ncbi:MAG: GIY-YIG nuclease family protein, partial [Bacteroidota bacterium]
QSEESGAFYKGATDNLARRLGEHNAGQVDSTRPYRPWNLVW